jgi:multidrug efflux pump subunit AcrA (membrane-fusion protein)
VSVASSAAPRHRAGKPARTRVGAWLVAGLGLCLVSACGGAPEDDVWVSVTREDWAIGIEVTGTLKATVSDTLGPPQVSNGGEYKIAKMAPEGARVAKGDVVLAFDTSDLERQLLERQNERDAVVAEIDRRMSDAVLRRRDGQLGIAECEGAVRKAALKAEGSEDLTSSLELQSARLSHELERKRLEYLRRKALATEARDRGDIDALRAKQATAEERIAKIQEAIGKMTLRAPRDATVIYATNWQGQKKKVGDGVWRGENVLEAAALDQMIALGDVAEADIAKLEVGQRVSLRLEAHPDVQYSGTVRSIGSLVEPPTPQSPLRVVRAQIALEASEPLRMRPGMRFVGTIETERLPRALRIPLSTVFLTGEGPVAYRQHGTGFTTARLELGRAHRDSVEVLGGVAEGDRVAKVDLGRAEREGL